MSAHSPKLRPAGALLSVCLLLLAGVAPAAVTGCSGGGDDPTGPSADVCSEASFGSQAEIGFDLDCGTYVASVTGIAYDQFSRVKSYNYDISCSGGSNRRAGRVYNIAYNELGQALTWDYTVNGSTCHKP